MVGERWRMRVVERAALIQAAFLSFLQESIDAKMGPEQPQPMLQYKYH